MQSYIYKGHPKPYPKINQQSKLFKNITWILCGSYPHMGRKTYGSKLLQKFNGSEILEYQLDFIEMVSENPRVVLISGISHREFLIHERSTEYSVIQNHFFEFTNSAEDLKLGLYGSTPSDIIFMESPVIPKLTTFQSLSKNKKSKLVVHSLENNRHIGINPSKRNYVDKFCYASKLKLSGIYYFCEGDVLKLRKKTIVSSYSKNKFAFELLGDIGMKYIVETNDENNK